jgi:hypothetical protein
LLRSSLLQYFQNIEKSTALIHNWKKKIPRLIGKGRENERKNSFIRSNKSRVELKRKKSRHKYSNTRESKKFDMQTCENDKFTCEFPTHGCIFLNIFTIRYDHFSEHTLKWDFNTYECDFYKQNVIFTRMSIIYISSVSRLFIALNLFLWNEITFGFLAGFL